MSANWRAVLGATIGFALAFPMVLLALPDRARQAVAPLPTRVVAARAESAAPQLAAPGAPATDAAVVSETATLAPVDAPPETNTAAREGSPPELGVLLWGTITLSDGAAVPDSGVWVHKAGGERLYVRPDTKGRYTLGPLPPGPHWVTGGAMHHHDAEVELVLEAGDELHRQDFVLRPKQRILVRLLTSTGEPTKEVVGSLRRYNAVPVATREDPGDTFTEVFGSLNNPFGIGEWWGWGQAGLPNLGGGMMGYVFLNEDGPAWLSFIASGQVLAKQRIDPTTEEVTFVLDPEDFLALRCEIRGRVVASETGAPLVANVSVGRSGGFIAPGPEVGSDGLFVIEDTTPGKWILRITAPGRARVVRTITLSPGETLDVGDVLLHPAVSLSGRVRNDAGEPMDAVLYCRRLDPSTGVASLSGTGQHKRELDGTFTIGSLEPGIYILGCRGLRARPPYPADASMLSIFQRVDLTGGSVEGLEVVLYPTTVITLVADGVTEPWPVATARDAAGLTVRQVYPGRWGVETPLHLLPGSYTLEIERDGVMLEQRQLVVGDEAQRIELDLE